MRVVIEFINLRAEMDCSQINPGSGIKRRQVNFKAI